MSVIDKLASSLNRRDEIANRDLAKEIAGKTDRHAVEELIDHLHHKNNAVQNDCIKVLYEIGAIKPGLISGHLEEFLALLKHKNNRLQWGAMTAISSIVREKPREIAGALPQIMEAAQKGSVISKDQAVNILIQLASLKNHPTKAWPLLLGMLEQSAPNQLPMYAENAIDAVQANNKDSFIKILESRMPDLDRESKKKRVAKVIRKVNKLYPQ